MCRHLRSVFVFAFDNGPLNGVLNCKPMKEFRDNPCTVYTSMCSDGHDPRTVFHGICSDTKPNTEFVSFLFCFCRWWGGWVVSKIC